MRIIAGEAKGRKLKSIKGTATRPTLDRVKEAIFNIIGFYLPAASGLDLFAGFGNLGLEALSRGAERFIFVEKDYRNVKIIKENIELCGFGERALVKKEDVFHFLNHTGKDFNLILMDPPYGRDLANRAVELILKRGLLSRDGLIVVEHRDTDKMREFPELEVIKTRNYGDTSVTIYQAGGGDKYGNKSSLSR